MENTRMYEESRSRSRQKIICWSKIRLYLAIWLNYVVLCGFDLLLSQTYLTPEYEANPLMKYVWSNFGFSCVAGFKGIVVLFLTVLCVYLFWENRNDYLLFVLLFGFFVNLAVVLSFIPIMYA